MSQLSDGGRPFRGSQVSVRSTPVGLLLSGKMFLWLLFLFSTSLITFVQATIDSVEAMQPWNSGNFVLEEAQEALEDSSDIIKFVESSLQAEVVKFISLNDVNKYEVKLKEKVHKVKSLAQHLKQSVVSLYELEEASGQLNVANIHLMGTINVLLFRECIHNFSKLGHEWERIRGKLTDAAKKKAFKKELDNVDFNDFARRLEAYEASVDASVHMDLEALETRNDDFIDRDFGEFVRKFNALRAALDEMKRQLPKSVDGPNDGPVDLSWYQRKLDEGGKPKLILAKGARPGNVTRSGERSWYMKKRWWITGSVALATVLGGGTYGLSPDFREWVNSKFISSDSNQVATTTSTFEPDLSTIATPAPELSASNDSNALVWIISGLVLLALAGATFWYFLWSGREQTSSSTDKVPKADDDKSGPKKGNSAATTTTASSATSDETSGTVNSKRSSDSSGGHNSTSAV